MGPTQDMAGPSSQNGGIFGKMCLRKSKKCHIGGDE